MEQTKYDVFISYSRNDYVRDDQIIPGNPITAIQEMFDQNGISYWFDKDGIYSGQEFVEVISNAIANSKMLVFVSSNHSNVSKWTAGEIFEADDGKKLIIPVRIDDCPYNKKFRMLVRPLDYVDYQGQPNTALSQLLRAVNCEKERLAKKEEDERLRLLKEQEEAKRETVKNEIKEKAKDYQALAGQQDYILKDLYFRNKIIGNTIKRCPVCEKEELIQSQFCSQCGWQFPKLYGIDGGNVPLHDEAQLAIARKCWEDLVRGTNDLHSLTEDFESQKLKWNEEKKELTDSFSDLREEMESRIMSKEEDLNTWIKEADNLSSMLDSCKHNLSSKEKECEKIEANYLKIVSDLNERITSLNSIVLEAEKNNKELMSQNTKLQEKCNILEIKLNDEKTKKSETSSKDGKKNVVKQKDADTAKPVIIKSSKSIQSIDEAFSVIESCCARKPIQDDFKFNKAKLSIDRLRPLLEKKYNIRITNSTIVACKDIGELKHLIFKCSKKTDVK